MTREDRFEMPNYSYAEADRIAGVTRGTTRRWLTASAKDANGAPRRDWDEPGASFFDLIEVAAIGRLKEAGCSMRAIREAIASCRETADLPRPLVSERLKALGGDAFPRGAWSDALAPFLEAVAYEDGLARRWWPMGREHRVVIDPDYGWGMPVVDGKGVRTENVYELHEANESLEDIAYSFNITPEQVEHAIQFEASLAA